MEILTTTRTAKRREEKDKYIQSAFVGWQITEFLKGAFSKNAKNLSFDKYIQNLGLKEKEKTTKEQREAEVKRLVSKAEQIKAKDQLRK